jgi:hypothetical protein
MEFERTMCQGAFKAERAQPAASSEPQAKVKGDGNESSEKKESTFDL